MMPALINKVSVSTAQKKAHSLLDRMQLNDRLHHKPSELSGGEQQRVAIARSLINDPAIILADEPTGNLDSSNSLIIFDMILQLRAELQQTFILVTHNDDLAKQSDRTLRMADGKTI